MPSLDHLINRATDATLTTDNYQYILDVCDKISSDPEQSTKQAITLLSTRLSSKDANVILRSLSLLVSIAENCGSRMKQEIATKSFLQDNLISKLSDKKLHITVKYRIVEVIEQLYNTFKSDPSLKPMTDAYKKAKSNHKQYFKSTQGPSKPAKHEIEPKDKKREDDELQRALKLSLQEYEREQTMKKIYLDNKPLPEQKEQQQEQSQENQPNQSPPNELQTVATVSKVRALYDLISYEEDELSFRKGDVITVIESVYRDWWRGSLPNGKIGIFPLNYVTPIVNKSAKEISQELSTEDNLINVEQKKIDRLLSILSSQDTQSINEDEITELYNQIIPLRPQLGKIIEKYNVRKEELSVLDNQLKTEVMSYNELLDRSISQRATQSGMYLQQQQQTQPVSQVQSHYTQQQQQSVPYPTGPGQPANFIPSDPYQQGNLQQQPTSAGFGNSGYNRPSQPY
ncbi:HSE1 [[Candida] subhashii]|uniref:Class E vacuolar protein-sorting machinery protein HSE1 n=1 Tax=[Candida] subhashii TaxID=561895 RepID=A0A8J5QKP9_9ASCO|nr:HSE1 [[Candida] subhashii]KAG7662235.1 HSE1 [[Candida] subhashii]